MPICKQMLQRSDLMNKTEGIYQCRNYRHTHNTEMYCLPRTEPGLQNDNLQDVAVDNGSLITQEAKIADINEEVIKTDLSLEDTNVREAIEREEREDHFSQYLPEFMINTDNEITALEASEHHVEKRHSRHFYH